MYVPTRLNIPIIEISCDSGVVFTASVYVAESGIVSQTLIAEVVDVVTRSVGLFDNLIDFRQSSSIDISEAFDDQKKFFAFGFNIPNLIRKHPFQQARRFDKIHFLLVG